MDSQAVCGNADIIPSDLAGVPLGWRLEAFGAVVLDCQYGLSVAASADGNAPMLRMNNIEDGRVVLGETVRVSLRPDELAGFRLHRGDLLFNRTNGRALVGKAAVFGDEGTYVFASYLVRFKLDQKQVVPEFACYVLNSPESRDLLQRLATPGVSQCNINPTVLKRHFSLPLPPLCEQRKIVQILGTWDRAVQQTSRLAEARATLKSGLMQQLLTGARRFPEFAGQEWTDLPLGQFLELELRPVRKPDSAYTAVSIRSHGKGAFLRAVDRPETVMMDTVYGVRKDDLIVSITFAWEGAVAIVSDDHEVGLVSHRFPTFTFDRSKVIPEYFRHVIRTKRFVRELGLVSPGGAGRNRVLNKSEFLKIKVRVPPVQEQGKIAALLGAVDREVELLEKQLDALKLQKKGLMQKLLTGEIRVKV